MSLSTWIDDGYTQDGKVEPVAGMHGGLTFKFRPAPDHVRNTYRRILDRNCHGDLKAEMKAAEDEAQYVVDVLVKQIVSWNGRDKVDEAGVKALHPDARSKAFDLVWAYPKTLEADAKN